MVWPLDKVGASQRVCGIRPKPRSTTLQGLQKPRAKARQVRVFSRLGRLGHWAQVSHISCQRKLTGISLLPERGVLSYSNFLSVFTVRNNMSLEVAKAWGISKAMEEARCDTPLY